MRQTAHDKKMTQIHLEAQEIVATGRCPNCGAPLLRNNALAGWWQCAAYACKAFRQPEYRELASCSFQAFTC